MIILVLYFFDISTFSVKTVADCLDIFRLSRELKTFRMNFTVNTVAACQDRYKLLTLLKGVMKLSGRCEVSDGMRKVSDSDRQVSDGVMATVDSCRLSRQLKTIEAHCGYICSCLFS